MNVPSHGPLPVDEPTPREQATRHVHFTVLTPEIPKGAQESGIFCICQEPDDDRLMIFCKSCGKWFHVDCVSNTKSHSDIQTPGYVCASCTNSQCTLRSHDKK